MNKEKEFKEENPTIGQERREEMGLFGRGGGLLGLRKASNPIVLLLVIISAIVGIAYFVNMNEVLLVLATIGVALAIIVPLIKRW